MDQFARTQLLLGKTGIERLHAARVAVFGVGGVGGFAAEALVRSGVGAVELFDDDRICLTNLNRQIIALRSTIGQYKVDVMAARLLDINPKAEVVTHKLFYMPDTAGSIDLTAFDYVIDAVDTVTAKLELASRCTRLGGPSSAPWARATSWILPSCASPPSKKPTPVPWPGSCAPSAVSGISRG